MGIVITIATFAILGFIGWLIYRAVRGRQVKAHHVIYGIAVITGIYAYGFFLTMNMSQPDKILVSIILGIILIILAALLQRRQVSNELTTQGKILSKTEPGCMVRLWYF